jgi:hypothetical protein
LTIAAWQIARAKGIRSCAQFCDPDRATKASSVPFRYSAPKLEVPVSMEAMIAAHPDVQGNTNDSLIACVQSCFDCAAMCLSCADACLAEQTVTNLRQCIRLNLDCADLCVASGALGLRRAGRNPHTIIVALEACMLACRLCAEECERHAGMHEHCRLCAESCRDCEDACGDAISSID